MGNTQYIKLKVLEHVATFVYIYNNTCIQRTIAIHPDNSFNKKIIKDNSYFKNYSGPYYTFDGDYDALDSILENYKPSVGTIGLLIEQLECECDLQRYETLWTKLIEWKNYVITVVKTTGEYIKPISWVLSFFNFNKQIENKNEPKMIKC